MVWVIISWWVSPTDDPYSVEVERDAEGRVKIFKTKREAERWGRKNLQPGMWKAVEI